jgi:tetratricopeptide (TPR) repeat protein
MADTTIHTGDGGRRKRSLLKPVLWALGVLLLVAAAASGGALLKKWQNTSKPVPPQQIALSAQDAALDGDLNGAQAQIDQALTRTDLSDENRYDLNYQKGTNFQNEGKNKEALESFKQAATYKQTYSLYNSMAAVAEAMGDLPGAIEYLKKAIPLVGAPPENMSAVEDKKSLEIKIEQLEGQL